MGGYDLPLLFIVIIYKVCHDHSATFSVTVTDSCTHSSPSYHSYFGC